jgi:hypothetical protein
VDFTVKDALKRSQGRSLRHCPNLERNLPRSPETTKLHSCRHLF